MQLSFRQAVEQTGYAAHADACLVDDLRSKFISAALSKHSAITSRLKKEVTSLTQAGNNLQTRSAVPSDSPGLVCGRFCQLLAGFHKNSTCSLLQSFRIHKPRALPTLTQGSGRSSVALNVSCVRHQAGYQHGCCDGLVTKTLPGVRELQLLLQPTCSTSKS